MSMINTRHWFDKLSGLSNIVVNEDSLLFVSAWLFATKLTVCWVVIDTRSRLALYSTNFIFQDYLATSQIILKFHQLLFVVLVPAPPRCRCRVSDESFPRFFTIYLEDLHCSHPSICTLGARYELVYRVEEPLMTRCTARAIIGHVPLVGHPFDPGDPNFDTVVDFTESLEIRVTVNVNPCPYLVFIIFKEFSGYMPMLR